MSFLNQITVLILTYNEEANIGRTLSALSPFSSVVVLDSGSTDRTIEIVKSFPNTAIFTRPFDSHAAQWNYGLRQCGLSKPWVLALDADYVVSAVLVEEIENLHPGPHTGFRAAFDYHVFGHPLSGTLYPPVTVLFRAQDASYIQAGHTQRLQTPGPIGTLSARIAHDDRKPLSRWFASQQKYAKLEADFLYSQPPENLRFSSRIRRLGWAAPLLVFVYTLLVKRCLFNGWPGWYYVMQRTIAEMMIAAEVIDRRLRRNETRPDIKSIIPLEEARQ